MCAQRVQLKTTIAGQQVPLNPYTDCVKNVRQQMPLAGSRLLGTTVLYVGPTTDTYSTGVCYTCKATESSSYYWEAVASGGGGGDVDITVNGIAPAEDGNIELTARQIPTPEKTEQGDNIIVSSVCGGQNLAQFYERMQGAVFNIDGNIVNTEEDSDGYHYTGQVDLQYYVESPNWSWIVQNIEYDYGDGQINPEKHQYLHTQIHEMLDKYSACAVNNYSAGEYKPGQIWLDAGRIPYAQGSNPDSTDGSSESIYGRIDTICYGTFTYPNYWGATGNDAATGNTYTPSVSYTAQTHGWLIIEWCSYDMQDDSYVEIDGKQFQLGTVNERGGSTWRQFIFPISAWATWYIYEDECRGRTIRFLPCTQLFSTE